MTTVPLFNSQKYPVPSRPLCRDPAVPPYLRTQPLIESVTQRPKSIQFFDGFKQIFKKLYRIGSQFYLMAYLDKQSSCMQFSVIQQCITTMGRLGTNGNQCRKLTRAEFSPLGSFTKYERLALSKDNKKTKIERRQRRTSDCR